MKYLGKYTDNNDIARKKDVDAKQDVITDIATIRTGATLGLTSIQEPSSEGTAGQVLSTDGNGARSWVSRSSVSASASGTSSSTVSYITIDGTEYKLASGDTLPSQSGNAGKFLATNGTSPLWASVQSAAVVETSYSDLKDMCDQSRLTPGTFYLINDYRTKTAAENTQNSGHDFNLIVFATSTATLDCRAMAVKRSDDTYFTAAGADLSKWQIWYDINNDTVKYGWANSANGKGVIYRMIDEWGNDCPYDFKNIRFKVGANTTAGTVDNKYYYTFSLTTDSDVTITDYSLTGKCFGNSFGKNFDGITCNLNFNVFRNTSSSSFCCENTFGESSIYILSGDGCFENTLMNECEGISFGSGCSYNSFGNGCKGNTIGNGGTYNSFGNGCIGVIFGNTSSLYGNYCRNNIFDNGCSYIRMYNSSSPSSSNYLQNVHVTQGVSGTSLSYVTLYGSSVPRNASYQIKAAMNSAGVLKVYCEADLIL